MKPKNFVKAHPTIKSYRLNYYQLLSENKSFDMPLSTFILPENMDEKDAFMVISYLMMTFSRDLEVSITSPIVMLLINEVLEKYHFKIVRSNENTVDLLNRITGKKKSNARDVLSWFSNSVSFLDVKGIYDKLNLSIPENSFHLLTLDY